MFTDGVNFTITHRANDHAGTDEPVRRTWTNLTRQLTWSSGTQPEGRNAEKDHTEVRPSDQGT